MSTEISIDTGMLFRKMYCSSCGTQLRRKKIKNVYRRGEPGFRNLTSIGGTINFFTYTTVEYIYRCPQCGKEISYSDQKELAKEQKKRNQWILD